MIGSQARAPDAIDYKDGTMLRDQRLQWDFSASVTSNVEAVYSGAYQTTPSGMRMEIETATTTL